MEAGITAFSAPKKTGNTVNRMLLSIHNDLQYYGIDGAG